MTREPDFIGLIEDYLDDFEGMTPLPDATRDAIRARLPATPQRPARWPGWRFPEMNTTTKYAIGTAAVVVLAIAGFAVMNAGNVGAGPALTDSPDSGFTSERYQYSLLFPDDSWQMRERPGVWSRATAFSEGSNGLDVADKVGESEPWVLLASQPLDVERDVWLERYDRLLEAAFSHCSLESSETRMVDGEQARINTYGCGSSSDGVEATMFHGEHVYAVRVFHPDDSDYDPRPVLDEFLSVFRFRD